MSTITDNNRVIYLTEEIKDKTIAEANKTLLKLIKEDNKKEKELKEFKREPIEIYINSFGGSVYDALSLVDIIIHSKTPIHTIVTGYAMSAAFIIFICGTKRFMSKYATLLLHQVSHYTGGKIGDLEITLAEDQRLQKLLESIILERTKITSSQLEDNRKTKTDWYISLTEAIKLGCVDEELIEI